MKKRALITGITGQDGSYMAELLLSKGYEVHGIKRRSSSFNTERIDHIYKDPHEKDRNVILHYGDLTDSTNLIRIVESVQPQEIYNFGAQSHVQVSFEMPEYTVNSDATGTLRLLEAIRIAGLSEKTRFFQASTSEMYGKVMSSPQNETTPFYPRSPYGAAKVFAYWITINYREAYNIFACNGIMFNHESPRRGETFVSRKITRGATCLLLGLQDCLYLGNLNARRDWGHAKDYMRAAYAMIQNDLPEDFVIATGESYSVRDLCIKAFEMLGITLAFNGSGNDENGVIAGIDQEKLDALDVRTHFLHEGDTVIRIDPRYQRPAEVERLVGDASKIKSSLGWEPEVTFEQMVHEMILSDLDVAQRKRFSDSGGFQVIDSL